MAQMGLPRGPSGVHGFEEDMGSCREIPVVCGPGGCVGAPAASVPAAYQERSAAQRRCVS